MASIGKVIEEEIRQAIISGHFRAHDKVHSEKQLSAEYSCNEQTVRKAMDRLVREGLLYKKPYSGTYVAPQMKKKNIVLVMPGEESLVRFCSNDELLESPYRFLEITEREYLRIVGDIKIILPDVAGLLFFRNPTYIRATFSLLRDAGISFCFLGSSMHELVFKGIPAVFYSEVEIVDMAMQTLWDAGCRKIGCIGNRGWPATDERYRQYKRWLLQAQCPWEERWQIMWPGTDDDAVFADICQRFGEVKGELDGVFGLGDNAAALLLQAAAFHRVDVPRDLKVVSVNNLPICNFIHPKITSVDLNICDGCKIAVELLTNQIENKKTAQHVNIPLKLILRESHCGKKEIRGDH